VAKKRKTLPSKRGQATVRPARRTATASTSSDKKIALLSRELAEAREQQAASSGILRVISGSPTDIQPVFDTIVANAVRLCGARMGAVFRFDGVLMHLVAHQNYTPEAVEILRRNYPRPPQPHLASGRAILARTVAQVEDVLADPNYNGEAARAGNWKGLLAVPILRAGEPIGVIIIARYVAGPFAANHIALLETFADQAVIAIENVRLFEEIEDKSRQLAEANQHKSQFLANMSHELRTPLNAILGYTELMADGVYGAPPEKMSAVLERIESNGKHLLSLINAVLDLSKIEAGQLKLDLTDYSLSNVVETVHSMVQPLAADKKLTFKTEVAPTLPPGHGDERRLTQVLLNLVGNAIKFTDAGEVVIKAAACDGLFALSVRDTGPGISIADQAKLFQEFQQADNSITRKKGGTGLGLAISKRIVEMHGGKIWLESQVGQGSTFFVTLPVRAEQQTQSS
jgi:signal transduction histidine kinase